MEMTHHNPEVKPHVHILASLQQSAVDDCKSLVRRISSGDPLAEHLLVKRYQSRVEHVARQLGANQTLREDLGQEVMLKVILNLRDNRLNDASKLRAYIDQTARFIYYGWQRNKNSQLEYQASCDEHEASPDDVAQMYLESRDREWLVKQIEQLKMSRDQELLLRFYLDHQEKCEVCEALDITDAQFDKLIFRARQRLKKVVQRMETEQYSGA